MTARNDLFFIITGDDTCIAYRFDGTADKPVLLLSNSIDTDLHMWDVTVLCLAEHSHVLRYDACGYSASDVPAGTYSTDRPGRDVVESFDAFGIRRMYTLGLSLGGIVAQRLIIHVPERIDRLVLSNAVAYIGPPGHFNRATAELLRAPDMQTTAEMFLRNWFPARMLEAHDTAVESFRRTLPIASREGIVGDWAVVRDADLYRTITLIMHPTLATAGQHDIVASVRHGEKVTTAIPGAQLCLSDTVHLTDVELPDAFLEAAPDFLGVHEMI